MAAHYFIAIPLTESIQDFFAVWQEKLKGDLPYKRWPHKQDLHITLKFLGPVADNKLMELKNELAAAAELQEFTIQAGGTGIFGNPQKPRVLWAGVEKSEKLFSLYEKVEEGAVHAGFPREPREYRPHITLAKKWAGNKGMPVHEIIDDFTECKTLSVTEFVIYRIHPGNSPKYQMIEKYRLQRDD